MRKSYIFALLIPLFLAGCHNVEDVPYITDMERDSAQQIITTYNSTILPGDVLYIYVESQSPESVIPFNQETNVIAASVSHRVITESATESAKQQHQQVQQIDPVTMRMSSNKVEGFMVDVNGTINYPILGRIPVAGLSQDSLSHLLQQRLVSEGYVSDPIVTIRLKNFRVTVVGEVTNPSQFHVVGERLTIFEALALAKDVTIYGLRNNVKVLRYVNGVEEVGEVDLTSKQVFDSPYYYLRQNDIVYVEPNDQKKKISYRNPEVPHYISMGISVANILVLLTRSAVQIQRNGW